jgi:hypothetical protein
MAAVSDAKHAWWFLSVARSSYWAINLLIRTDPHDDLSHPRMHGLRLLLLLVLVDLLPTS